jgi:hypothetical protein
VQHAPTSFPVTKLPFNWLANAMTNECPDDRAISSGKPGPESRTVNSKFSPFWPKATAIFLEPLRPYLNAFVSSSLRMSTRGSSISCLTSWSSISVASSFSSPRADPIVVVNSSSIRPVRAVSSDPTSRIASCALPKARRRPLVARINSIVSGTCTWRSAKDTIESRICKLFFTRWCSSCRSISR